MFTSAKAKSRPRPRFIAWSIQTIANGSSRRAFFNGPASTGSKPSLPTSSITCACRKSDSAILMMKATKDRLECDRADALNRPMERGILVQRAMNARYIIISGKLAQDPAQVRLPEHDHVVETFPSDRADQSLDVRVLPRRSGRDRLVPNAHCAQTLHEDQALRSVPVPNKVTRCTVPGERLGDLARNPLRGRICRHPARHTKS